MFSQFEFLRAHVESVVAPPAAIMLTSAKARDGKSLVAHGLAERLADAGKHVVLVEYRPVDAMHGLRHADFATRRQFPIVTLPLDEEGSPVASPALRTTISDSRAKYDYTIVDGAPLLASRVAILLASIVDGILVSLRLGRASDDDDVELVKSLQRADANVLGVVAASARDIAAFAKPRDSHHSGDVVTPMLPATPFGPLEAASFPVFEGRRP